MNRVSSIDLQNLFKPLGGSSKDGLCSLFYDWALDLDPDILSSDRASHLPRVPFPIVLILCIGARFSAARPQPEFPFSKEAPSFLFLKSVRDNNRPLQNQCLSLAKPCRLGDRWYKLVFGRL